MAAKPNIGILSIGDMGMGIAKLLRSDGYIVYTVESGRSQATLNRARRAEIISLPTDEALVVEADIIFSIVPPRDAFATAKRILDACKSNAAIAKRSERKDTTATGQAPSLLYVDLNAISTRTAKSISSLLHQTMSPSSASISKTRSRTSSFPFLNSDSPDPQSPPIPLPFLDGGIIGGPPFRQPDNTWKKPSVVVSGPNLTTHLPASLIETLNIKPISDKIGPASALKSCFAAMSKGFTAISILSYTTAHAAGVLPHLRAELEAFNPASKATAERGLVNMPPKAYRWVEEMRQIGETFSEEGGFGAGMGGLDMFHGVADLYDVVAKDTPLGAEKTENRKRGLDVEDVTAAMAEGIRKRRRVVQTGDEDLKLAWKSSWS